MSGRKSGPIRALAAPTDPAGPVMTIPAAARVSAAVPAAISDHATSRPTALGGYLERNAPEVVAVAGRAAPIRRRVPTRDATAPRGRAGVLAPGRSRRVESASRLAAGLGPPRAVGHPARLSAAHRWANRQDPSVCDRCGRPAGRTPAPARNARSRAGRRRARAPAGGTARRSCAVLADRGADERPVLGPRAVVTLHVRLVEQLVQHEPGVRAAFTDPAVGDGVLAEVDAGLLVELTKVVVGLERAVVVGGLGPRDVRCRRDVAGPLGLFLRQVRRREQLPGELLRGADVDEVVPADRGEDLVAECADVGAWLDRGVLRLAARGHLG